MDVHEAISAVVDGKDATATFRELTNESKVKKKTARDEFDEFKNSVAAVTKMFSRVRRNLDKQRKNLALSERSLSASVSTKLEKRGKRKTGVKYVSNPISQIFSILDSCDNILHEMGTKISEEVNSIGIFIDKI